MKFIILACLVSCALGDLVIPRLPLSVLMRGNVHLVDSNRIVGGTVVEPNSLPFQVSLQRRGIVGYSQSCGGSILSASVILNAAHCVSGANVANMRIVAGEHSLSTVSGLEQNRDVASYKMHESYSSSTFQNDISLIFLSAPLDLSVPSASAIGLPAQGQQTSAGTPLIVSGWGTTSSGGSISDELRRVEVPAVSDDDCNSSYGAGSIYPSMICAGVPQGGVDSCQGDSGGPLFTENPFVQIGIVSWGYGCAVAGYPGVYTEVSYFVDWINANSK
nr:trypsin [Diaphanosoma celebensis]